MQGISYTEGTLKATKTQMASIYWLGRLLLSRKPGGWLHNRALRLLGFCADQGHMGALTLMGHLLCYRGANPAAKQQGKYYLQLLSQRGDAKAQYQLALIGEADDQLNDSLMLYTQAAKQGHYLAIKKMINVYESGLLGMSVNVQQQAYWKNQEERIIDVRQG